MESKIIIQKIKHFPFAFFHLPKQIQSTFCFRKHPISVPSDAIKQILEIYSKICSSCILYATLIPRKIFCWFVDLTCYFLWRRCFIHKGAKQSPLRLCFYGTRLPLMYFVVTMLEHIWHNLCALFLSPLKDGPLFLKEQYLDQYGVVKCCHFSRTYSLKRIGLCFSFSLNF